MRDVIMMLIGYICGMITTYYLCWKKPLGGTKTQQFNEMYGCYSTTGRKRTVESKKER